MTEKKPFKEYGDEIHRRFLEGQPHYKIADDIGFPEARIRRFVSEKRKGNPEAWPIRNRPAGSRILEGAMTFNRYQDLTDRTADPTISCKNAIREATMKLTVEAAEAMAHITKFEFHGQPIDDHAVALDLGEALFYIARAARALGYSLQEIAEMNEQKRRMNIAQ